MVLGGTHQHGDWNTRPYEKDSRFITSGCQAMFPSLLAGAEKIKDWVGLRPGRPSVRLEREILTSKNGRRVQVTIFYPTKLLPFLTIFNSDSHKIKLESAMSYNTLLKMLSVWMCPEANPNGWKFFLWTLIDLCGLKILAKTKNVWLGAGYIKFRT